MATTRLIAMHKAKTGTLLNSIRKRVDYVMDPDKTDNGELISTYLCNKETVLEEFLLTKNEYLRKTGRTQQSDIIAYQIRQAFKPGEITPEKANELGYELAMRFTKGKYAFVICTHIDRAHIHNHVVFNSTSLDATHKYLNFWLCGLALQRVSDLICLENGLSVISNKVFVRKNKKDIYKNKKSFREIICKDITLAYLKEHADAIVLATIDTIDHADMKNLKYGTTYGMFRVLKTLYGKIDQGKQLPYNKEGGIIKYEDWNSVHDVELDPSYRYIRSCFDIDILLEAGKTYLMYVEYNEELHSYTIIGYGEGVREVKGTDVKDVSALQIKNNLTHVYESLENYCIELEKSQAISLFLYH